MIKYIYSIIKFNYFSGLIQDSIKEKHDMSDKRTERSFVANITLQTVWITFGLVYLIL